MIFPLQYLIETTNWHAPVAIVGNGESQIKWRLNPERVDVFAINKALWAYDPPIVVTAGDHAGAMQDFVYECGNHSEIIAITDQDALEHGLRRVSTFNLITDLVFHFARAEVYLFGIDFSIADRDWSGIAGAFVLSLRHYKPPELHYIGDCNKYLPMLTPEKPKPEHVLVQP